jgi:23S rRNA G2445 N2-methylase RlmL
VFLMKVFVLVEKGLEEVAEKELSELAGSAAQKLDSVVSLEVADNKELLKLLLYTHSARRVIVALGQVKALKELDFSSVNLNWGTFFKNITFKVEVEGVKGNDNRIAIAKEVAGKIFGKLEKESLSAKLEMKKPLLRVVVLFNGEEYFVGLDLCSEELSNRAYRVFAHAASFKGDVAYLFVRLVEFSAGKKLLVGYMKDGTIAIEAALFANNLAVHECADLGLKKFGSCEKLAGTKEKTVVEGIDETRHNVISALKNAQIANAGDFVSFRKITLEDIDVKYEKNSFDCAIFQITTKDEEKLNELYYQIDYVVKARGKVLFITRKNVELSISSKFESVEKRELLRGDSVHILWLLRKK